MRRASNRRRPHSTAARWLLVLAAVTVAVACAQAEPELGEPDESASRNGEVGLAARRYGVALSPRSYTEDGMAEFLEHIVEAGQLLSHAGDWRHLESSDAPFDVVVELARSHGLDPVVVVSASSAGQMLRAFDDDELAGFVAALTRFVDERRPPVLGIGNEINMLATDDPAGFERWVAAWPVLVDAVRQVAPDTKVVPVFQYEWLLGLRGGVFGRETTEPQWDLLDRFPDADAIGVTSFPGLVHAEPEDLPDDYYRRISAQTDLPVFITETGWPARGDGLALPGSESAQAAFVERMSDLLDGSSVEIVIWPFVYDTLVEQPAFASYGLRRDDGTPRPAWHGWVELAGASAR